MGRTVKTKVTQRNMAVKMVRMTATMLFKVHRRVTMPPRNSTKANSSKAGTQLTINDTFQSCQASERSCLKTTTSPEWAERELHARYSRIHRFVIMASRAAATLNNRLTKNSTLIQIDAREGVNSPDVIGMGSETESRVLVTGSGPEPGKRVASC